MQDFLCRRGRRWPRVARSWVNVPLGVIGGAPEQRFGGFARSALAGPFAVSWPLHHALLGVVADRGRALQLVWE
jgi:hypothetical protein